MKWAAGALVLILYLVWPYYTLIELGREIHNGDGKAIGQRLDFQRVRASLRGQVMAQVRQAGTSDTAGEVKSVNILVHRIMSPEGMRGLVYPGNGAPSIAADPSSGTRSLWERVAFAFFVSPIDFRLELGPPDTSGSAERLVVTMHFTGAGWQVSDVRLPGLKASGLPEIGPTPATIREAGGMGAVAGNTAQAAYYLPPGTASGDQPGGPSTVAYGPDFMSEVTDVGLITFYRHLRLWGFAPEYIRREPDHPRTPPPSPRLSHLPSPYQPPPAPRDVEPAGTHHAEPGTPHTEPGTSHIEPAHHIWPAPHHAEPAPRRVDPHRVEHSPRHAAPSQHHAPPVHGSSKIKG